MAKQHPGLSGVLLVLCAYASAGAWMASHLRETDRPWLRLALILGLVAAAIYAVEISLEYVLLPRDNARYGVIEFGLVCLCCLSVGFIATLKTGHARDGLMAAVAPALISTLLWYIVLLAVSYSMKGTPRQAAVFRAEGNSDDFAQSGSANFGAWVFRDFLAAGFFHLLLGPLVVGILGSVGGMAGNLLRWRPGKGQLA